MPRRWCQLLASCPIPLSYHSQMVTRLTVQLTRGRARDVQNSSCLSPLPWFPRSCLGGKVGAKAMSATRHAPRAPDTPTPCPNRSRGTAFACAVMFRPCSGQIKTLRPRVEPSPLSAVRWRPPQGRCRNASVGNEAAQRRNGFFFRSRAGDDTVAMSFGPRALNSPARSVVRQVFDLASSRTNVFRSA